MYLVIDTATKDLGVALMNETEVAGQFHWRTRQNPFCGASTSYPASPWKGRYRAARPEGICCEPGAGGILGVEGGDDDSQGVRRFDGCAAGGC